MGYDYQVERPKLFTESGQKQLFKMRDLADKLMKEAGAVAMHKLMDGDSWSSLACADRLIELGFMREVTSDVWGQHRVFVRCEP